jgi:hypothetical protein
MVKKAIRKPRRKVVVLEDLNLKLAGLQAERILTLQH